MPQRTRLALPFIAATALLIAPAATAATAWTAAGLVVEAASSALAAAPEKRRRKKKKRRPSARKKKGDSRATSKGAADGTKPAASAAPTKPGAEGESNLGGLRRSNSMEFDARLVTGERPQAGAVYLFQRAPRQLPALVQLRQSYLRNIIDPVLGSAYTPLKQKRKRKLRKAQPRAPKNTPSTRSGRKGRR